ncbi:hypothetical protein ACSMXN_23935 [Jatrophihabitans sp. DSM 45814]
MRTENDLRTALAQRADSAPDLLPSGVGEPRRPRWQTTAGIALAAATVVALVAVPTVLIRDRSPGRHDNAAAGPAGSSTIGNERTNQPAAGNTQSLTSESPTSTATVPGAMSWVTVSIEDPIVRDMRADVEYLSIEVLGGHHLQIAAFAPGRFSMSQISDPIPVTVVGQPGYFGQASVHNGPRPSVAWQVTPDQWVILQGDPPELQDAAGLSGIAAKLGLEARTAPVTVPIKVGYLPTGWTLQSASIVTPGPDQPASSASAAIAVQNGKQTIVITVRAGTAVGADKSAVSRIIDGHVLSVESKVPLSSPDTVQKVLSSLTLASQPDRQNSSWFTLSQALPRS